MTSDISAQPSSSTTSSPKPPTIEVERKFSVPSNYKTVLAEHGFDLVKEFKETLSDDYFDTFDYNLMQADHWLRRRNGDWELKYPVRKSRTMPGASNFDLGTVFHSTKVGALNKEDSNSTTLYHETSNAEDIQSKLNAVGKGIGHRWKSGKLTCYAHLETERW